MKIITSNRREGKITNRINFHTDIQNSIMQPLRTDHWICEYGLKNLRLTNSDLNSMINECTVFKEAQLESAISGLCEFEDRLSNLILNLTRRINWMLCVR